MYNEYKKVQTIYNIIIINNIHFNFTNNIHFIWLFQNIFIYIDFVLCISLTYILLSYPLFTLDVSISYFLCIMQVNSGFRWQSCVCVWFIRRGCGGVFPESQSCTDALISERYLTLKFTDRVECWEIQHPQNKLVWKREQELADNTGSIQMTVHSPGHVLKVNLLLVWWYWYDAFIQDMLLRCR